MNLLNINSNFSQNLKNPGLSQKTELIKLKNIFDFSNYNEFTQKFKLNTYDSLLEKEFFNNFPKKYLVDNYVRTSGTSGNPKIIPISKNYCKANHQKASHLAFYNLIVNFNQKKILTGKNLILTGYKYEESYKGKNVLDISAYMTSQHLSLSQKMYFPNKQFYNWKDKLQYLKEISHKLHSCHSLSGVPTWMISLFNNLQDETNLETKFLFKKLNLIIHGGVDFTNYFEGFNNIFSDRELTYFETYNSTEGFYAFQFTEFSNHLLLLTNCGIFFEFIDNKNVVPIWDVKPNKTYELVISNGDGLLRYRTQDLIKVYSVKPLLFNVIGRTSEYINAFGEDLSLEQCQTSITQICQRNRIDVLDYFVVPCYSKIGMSGYHEWHFFSDNFNFDINEAETLLDLHLQKLNNNYCQKRHNSIAMSKLKIYIHPTSKFKTLFKNQNKATGGQSKIKKLHNNRDILKHLK